MVGTVRIGVGSHRDSVRTPCSDGDQASLTMVSEPILSHELAKVDRGDGATTGCVDLELFKLLTKVVCGDCWESRVSSRFVALPLGREAVCPITWPINQNSEAVQRPTTDCHGTLQNLVPKRRELQGILRRIEREWRGGYRRGQSRSEVEVELRELLCRQRV